MNTTGWPKLFLFKKPLTRGKESKLAQQHPQFQDLYYAFIHTISPYDVYLALTFN